MKKTAALSLAELLVSMSIFSAVSMVTFLMYNNVRFTVARSTARMDNRSTERVTLQRLAPLLASAYIPPINGVTTPFETPTAPYPSGVNPAQPLAATGPGTSSIIFYAPGDLIDGGAELLPVCAQTGTYNPLAGPKLYEIRLDQTYANDPAASYQVGQFVSGNSPPLVMSPLMLREMYIPDVPAYQPNSTIRYLVPPTSVGGSPTFSATPDPTTPTRVLARGLSDVRFSSALGGTGIQVVISAQDRETTLNNAEALTISNTSLSTCLFYLAGH